MSEEQIILIDKVMNESRVIIAADNFGSEWCLHGPDSIGVIIALATTGVICNVQCGGNWCRHPTIEDNIEGYPIYLYSGEEGELDSKGFRNALRVFNDCRWGHIWHGDTNLIEYAAAIDEFLTKILVPNNANNITINFDYERIEEVMEGWWPILFQFPKNCYSENNKKLKGYLHLGNCD